MNRRAIAALAAIALLSACSDGKKEAGVSDGETRISCGNAPVSVFDQPPRALGTSEPDRVARDDPAMIGDDLKTAAVWRTYQDGDTLAYLGGEPPQLHLVTMKRVYGTWRWQGGGDCTAYVKHEGRTTATWWPASQVDPVANTFEVWASDLQCASGRPAESRVGQAVIKETETSVVVTFTATPLSGFQNCPSHEPARRTVHLRMPLDQRTLLDGALFPPQPPRER